MKTTARGGQRWHRPDAGERVAQRKIASVWRERSLSDAVSTEQKIGEAPRSPPRRTSSDRAPGGQCVVRACPGPGRNCEAHCTRTICPAKPRTSLVAPSVTVSVWPASRNSTRRASSRPVLARRAETPGGAAPCGCRGNWDAGRAVGCVPFEPVSPPQAPSSRPAAIARIGRNGGADAKPARRRCTFT